MSQNANRTDTGDSSGGMILHHYRRSFTAMFFDDVQYCSERGDEQVKYKYIDGMDTGEVFPYRRKFAVKVTLLLILHVVALLVAALATWTRWHTSVEADRRGILIVSILTCVRMLVLLVPVQLENSIVDDLQI